jgi:hypothetical protein
VDPLADISLLQLAKTLGSNTASGIVQKLGAKWPPPPIISMRSVLHCLPNQQWTSYEQTQTISPFSLCTPQDLVQLVAIIKNAEANGRKVHALGSGWSFSDCALTQDVLIDTTQLRQPIQTVQQAITASPKPLVFHVQGGITIHDLYVALDGFTDPTTGQALPLALETMGGASGQTLAGAVSTGTHGGDLFMGPLADSVLAIHLVGAGGTQYWLEPTAAITDKNLLRQFVIPDVPLQNIVYDDDWFNAALVSIGCMGVIYAVVLRVRLQYFLVETTTESTWQSFKGTASTQLSDKTSRFLQLAINPYTGADGTNLALITTRQDVPILPVPPPSPVTPPTQVMNALLGLCADLLATIAANPLGSGFDAVKVIVQTLIQAIQSGDYSNAILINLVNNILSGAPELRSILANDYGSVMVASWPPRTVGDKSFKVMDGRFRPQFGPADSNPLRVDSTGGYSIELFLPTQVTGGTPPTPYYIGFIDNLINLVNTDTSTFLVGYVGVRFTGPTRAFLGMQQWDQTCSVEISALPNINGEKTLLTAILDSIYDYPLGNALPLPHWGQMIDLNIQGYGDRYPNYAKWQQVYAALSNNFTTRTFENCLSSRWQLTYPPSFMDVETKFLGKSLKGQVLEVTILFTATDTTTQQPVEGAAITVNATAAAKGATSANGTLQLTFPACHDPETKTPMECSGMARKEHYQDVYFVTPTQ